MVTLLWLHHVNAESPSWTETLQKLRGNKETEAASVKKLETFWSDPSEIIRSLDEYESLWVQPHGCVWSECDIDDTDDGYTGDNRDGDEHWYQYRTQEFCANAAYSLYGVKKNDTVIMRSGSNIVGCNRYAFINSFFTYGGADNLLSAVGLEPNVYYGGDDGENGDDAHRQSNAQCLSLEVDEESGDKESGDGDDLSSTLGCAADGSYAIAAFEAYNCDGNYFQETIHPFESYNEQHESIGCKRIYGSKINDGDEASIMFLLLNSWTCNLDLYPNGCPDPYGKKERYEFAMKTVAHGGNSDLAYKNMLVKQPLRISSCVFSGLAFLFFVFAYYYTNLQRIASKGGKGLGYIRCLWEDFLSLCGIIWVIFMAEITKLWRKSQQTDRTTKEDNDDDEIRTMYSDATNDAPETLEAGDGTNYYYQMEKSSSVEEKAYSPPVVELSASTADSIISNECTLQAEEKTPVQETLEAEETTTVTSILMKQEQVSSEEKETVSNLTQLDSDWKPYPTKEDPPEVGLAAHFKYADEEQEIIKTASSPILFNAEPPEVQDELGHQGRSQEVDAPPLSGNATDRTMESSSKDETDPEDINSDASPDDESDPTWEALSGLRDSS